MSLPARWAAVAAAFVVLLCAASTASAATFSQPNGGLSYDAAAGETNDLTIANPASGVWDFADPGATITPAGPCVQGSDVHHAHCTGVTGLITANLGDGDDDATFSGALAGPQTGVFLFGQDGRDDLTGSPGADVMVGDTFQGFDDSLDGGAGDDQLTGGPGADVLTGGPGEDSTTYSPPYNTGPVTVTVGNGAADDGNPVDDASTGGVPGTLDDVEVEDVTGTLWGGDHLTGDDDANVLREDLCCGTDPPAGSTIEGAGGNDRLIGSAAADVLVGGPGTDDFFAKAGDDRVEAADGVGESVLCDAGDDSGHADVTDGLDQCEDVIVTSSVPPPTPAQPTTTPGDGQVALDWPAVTGATHYTVTQWEQPTPAETTTVDRATNHHDALDLANGHTYCWTITALNPAGASSPSPAACATPQGASSPPVPGTPSRPAVQLVNAQHDPNVGEPLKFTLAAFSGSPTPTVTYQWIRCPNSNFPDTQDTATGCTAIGAAAVGSTYTLRTADAGSFVGVRAHAANTAGTRDRDSTLVGRVIGPNAPPVPGSPSRPVIALVNASHDPRAGEQLKLVTKAQFTGTPTPAVTHQWVRCTGKFTAAQDTIAGCTSIPGATDTTTYILQAADEGKYVAVRAHAVNAAGSRDRDSDEIGQVLAAPRGDVTPPVIRIAEPLADTMRTEGSSNPVYARFSCSDSQSGDSGLSTCTGRDGNLKVSSGDVLDPTAGRHTFTVRATDKAGNTSTQSVSWVVTPDPKHTVTPSSLAHTAQQQASHLGGTVDLSATHGQIPPVSFTAGHAETAIVESTAIIGQDSGSLIGYAGGTLIGYAGGTLIGYAGGTLIGYAGGTLIGFAGGTFGATVPRGASFSFGGNQVATIAGGASGRVVAARVASSAKKRRRTVALLGAGGHTFAKKGKAKLRPKLTKAGRRAIRNYLRQARKLRRRHKRVKPVTITMTLVVGQPKGKVGPAYAITRRLRLKP